MGSPCALIALKAVLPVAKAAAFANLVTWVSTPIAFKVRRARIAVLANSLIHEVRASVSHAMLATMLPWVALLVVVAQQVSMHQKEAGRATHALVVKVVMIPWACVLTVQQDDSEQALLL